MIKNPFIQHQMFSAPIPGQSLTTPPKSMPYEKPPQFTKLEDAVHFVMTQLTTPIHMKQLLALMDAGMPIEAIARTILFTGFTLGQWSPDLGLLMYRPVMLSLIAIAHKAGMKDTPITLPSSLDTQIKNNSHMLGMVQGAKGQPSPEPMEAPMPVPKGTDGFMSRRP